MYFNKTFTELTDDEVISLHIDRSETSSTNDYHIQSTLYVISREARHCLGNRYTKNMMPFIGAFAAFDQVGNSYARSDMTAYSDPAGNTSGIKKALYYFGGFGPNDNATKTLYAFRNALMHNASLVNEKGGTFHSFIYDETIAEPVAPAAQAWNGQLTDLNDATTSHVNPRRLVDLVDKMIAELSKCLKGNTLQPLLVRSDIISRYLLLRKK